MTNERDKMTKGNDPKAGEQVELRKLVKARRSMRVKAAQEAAARLTVRLRCNGTARFLPSPKNTCGKGTA